ncbi:type ISP restriction/modification enzyme [Streptacidiphilus monticola]
MRGVAPQVVRARWQRLAEAEEPDRARLFRVSRSRRLTSGVAQLPGQATPTHRLSLGLGDCPAPVRVRVGAFDRQWLLPDARLLDQPRPELWRVADRHQVFVQLLPGPEVAFSAEPRSERSPSRSSAAPGARSPTSRPA